MLRRSAFFLIACLEGCSTSTPQTSPPSPVAPDADAGTGADAGADAARPGQCIPSPVWQTYGRSELLSGKPCTAAGMTTCLISIDECRELPDPHGIEDDTYLCACVRGLWSCDVVERGLGWCFGPDGG